MQPEIMSRGTIKPSSPTPPHLRTHSFSLFDQRSPELYVPIVYFYPKCCSDTSSQLKNSLSKTLSFYYPFAGRVRERVSIDCNDEGVVFLEGRIKCMLSEILENPKAETTNLLFPDDLQWKDSKLRSLVAVQISYFDCGGMAIGVCLSHKVGDAATMASFINDWATMTRNPDGKLSPEFNLASMFPQGDLPILPEAVTKEGNSFSKRFVFDASKIAALKAIVGDKVKNPTRVEVVTALVYKCAISASRSSSGSTKPTLLLQTINMRKRVEPPLPENTMGNLASLFAVSTMEGESDIELHGLVGQMKESMANFCDTYAKKFRGEEWLSTIKENLKESRKLFIGGNQVVYTSSSWCNFPLYEADFGWGKPIWVTVARCAINGAILLMDTSGNGVEVFVTLEEQDMAVFERDAELLEFASSNPSALDSDLKPTSVN